MNRMLDELKKLDVDYDVPADFRKKVMAKIKEENKVTKKSKVIPFKRYAIACASIAAMVIVTINVGKIDSKNLMDSATQESNSAPNFAKNDMVAMDKTEGLEFDLDYNAGQSVGLKDSTLDTAIENKNMIPSSVKDNLKENFRNDEFMQSVDSINEAVSLIEMAENILIEENINYEKEDNKLIVEKDSLEKIKEKFGSELIEKLEFAEDEGLNKIQIIMK